MTYADLVDFLRTVEPQPFTRELRFRIWRRQGGHCWLCPYPVPAIDCAHRLHRGMGGDDRRNHPMNLIYLCDQHHRQLDGKAEPRLHLPWYDPEDRWNGLVVAVERADRCIYMPSNRLWFYRQ